MLRCGKGCGGDAAMGADWAAGWTALWERERDRVALWTPAAIGLGIWAYFAWPSEPPPGGAWAAAVAAAGLLTLRAWVGGAGGTALARALLAAAALAAIGFSAASWRAWSAAAPVWPERSEAVVEGRVEALAPLGRGGARWRAVLTDLTIEGVAASTTPARVRVSGPWVESDGPEGVAAAWVGRRVRWEAVLSPPPGPVEPGAFDFRRRAWFQRLGAVGYAKAPPVEAAQAPLSLWERGAVQLAQLRAEIAARARAASPGAEGAIVAALLVGDRSAVPEAATEALRRSNLAHLLAISGLHMGIVCVTVFGLVRLLLSLHPGPAAWGDPKKAAAVAALIAGAGYLALSGASVSTQRAYLMAVVAFCAVLVDRPAITLRAVALAATLILLWRPESLLAPGFQLSFAATTALVAAFEAARAGAATEGSGSGGAGWRVWGGALLLSGVVAGAATAPYAAFFFQRLTRYGLIANLAAVPAMGAWIMPCGAAALVLAPFGLEAWAFQAMALGVSYVLWVAETVAAWPGAVAPVAAAPSAAWAAMAFGAPMSAMAAITLGGLWLCLWRSVLLRAVGLAPMALGAGLWAAAPRPDVLIAPDGGLIGVMTAAGRAVDRDRAKSFVASSWLRRDGDAATQAQAAARPAFERFRGGAWAPAPDGWRVELSLARRLTQRGWARACRPGTILVAPRLTSRPAWPRDCVIFDQPELAARGAAAIWVAGPPLEGAGGESFPNLQVLRASPVQRLWTKSELWRQ